MINLQVKIDARPAIKQLDGLAKKLQTTIIARSLNRVADMAKTQAVRDISKQYNLTSRQVRDRIYVKPASARNNVLTAEIRVPLAKGRYRALQIADLKGTKDLRNSFGRIAGRTLRMARRDRKGNITTKGGVQFSILKGKRSVLPNAFIAPGKNSGKLIVFQREDQTNPRSKLKAMYTVDVPSMFRSRRVNDALVRMINEKLDKEIASRLAFELSKTAA